MTTSAEAAAREIADACLDPKRPMRNGCDVVGRGLLEGWRAHDDESWMTDMLKGLGLSPDDAGE